MSSKRELSGQPLLTEAAARDLGDVTWSSFGGTLTILGVVLNGFGPIGPVPVTITLPSTYGHYSYPTDHSHRSSRACRPS